MTTTYTETYRGRQLTIEDGDSLKQARRLIDQQIEAADTGGVQEGTNGLIWWFILPWPYVLWMTIRHKQISSSPWTIVAATFTVAMTFLTILSYIVSQSA